MLLSIFFSIEFAERAWSTFFKNKFTDNLVMKERIKVKVLKVLGIMPENAFVGFALYYIKRLVMFLFSIIHILRMVPKPKRTNKPGNNLAAWGNQT